MENKIPAEDRRRIKQRLIEVVATEVQGVSPAALGGWRKHGNVPHHRRFDLTRQAAELGLTLDVPADFENWTRISVR